MDRVGSRKDVAPPMYSVSSPQVGLSRPAPEAFWPTTRHPLRVDAWSIRRRRRGGP